MKSQTYTSTLTPEGEVKVPAEVLQLLHLSAQDKVIFRVVNGRVELEPQQMSLEEVYGSVPPLSQPEDFKQIKKIASEERAEKYRKKQQSR
jgi:bifunctional DNA-binding transcriptional regulator/antitoxin component of YhaV-PrlF toxin-antitoxin module